MILSIADIFIKRPVLTTVCTILIVLLGAVCLPLLPIEYIPEIAPTQVQISASYVGADPQTIETTVTTPIERTLTTTPNLSYFTSNTVSGTSSISAYFPVNTDKYIDQVNVQNNLQQATTLLPTEVQQQGVTVKTASTSILLVYGFYSPNDQYDAKFISNYVDLYINDEIARVPGVGQVNIFGQQQYAMRLWLDPDALASRGITVSDVVSAVQSQNAISGGGAIGSEPAPKGQRYQIPLELKGQIQSVADAENIVVKKDTANNTLIKLKDVGRAELGAKTYTSATKVNGKPGVALAVYQFPGSNALDVANQVRAKMATLQQSFPPGITTEPVYDTVSFIEESNKEVLYTLAEAIALVIVVIFVFLQNWRATIIPTVAIPVSLLGAMIFATVLGFSINSLTMFGLVLATGLVVDDAILVIEAIAAKIEQGMSAQEASFEAMNELTGAVIATSLVLMAVFVPVAFFPGATGLLYRQFALIIAFSIAVSTFNALSFSPSFV
jgi:hydrophobic/amphiphilic exporter-1 (mainly G- bacteria), HAE1 family